MDIQVHQTNNGGTRFVYPGSWPPAHATDAAFADSLNVTMQGQGM